MAVIFALIILVLLAGTNSEETNSPEAEVDLSIKHDGGPSSVNNRFFDLGGIVNQLFPGFNPGNQGGPGRNPGGMDSPANSQFYPNLPIQGQNPQLPVGQGTWPAIDDAQQYPIMANPQQPQYPSQGNFGGYPQTPNTGNINGVPQMTPYPQYPQGNFGGNPPNQYPQYPNSGNFGTQPIQNSQYPVMGGSPNQYPQYPSQGGFGRQPINNAQYPSQGGFMNPVQNPISNPGFGGMQAQPQYPPQPGMNGGNQYPSQGGFGNPMENDYGGDAGDGTLDSVIPPQDGWTSETPTDFSPDQNNNGRPNMPPDYIDESVNGPSPGANAILGNPVVVPPSTTERGRIIYPSSSTQSPATRQCVQDCQTTTEYNPVCGSDNITYINPGKFVCARNCGINVFVASRGRCPNDALPFSFPRPGVGKFGENAASTAAP